ncbi:MAG TPA: CRISPR-associated endonuclease Cas3'' [Gemmatirosa sp.]
MSSLSAAPAAVELEDRPAVFAHSRPGADRATWELLPTHLDAVADLAAKHAAAFDSAAWGRLAGLWHDLGKYRPEFQRRICGERIEAPHAGVGAALAHPIAPPIAFAIAGHHAGLANHVEQHGTAQTPLKRRIADEQRTLADVKPLVPAARWTQPRPAFPGWLADGGRVPAERLELWTRFLFSALVDADRLATEAFYDPEARTRLTYDDVPTLRARLDAALDAFVPDTPVKAVRARVLADCRAAAARTPGLFSLTVPTGGGKTLSGMAFALRHAERHGLRRVIVVVPYTSIIEQNATVYRDALGARNVIEHHSAIDEVARREASTELEVRRKLAADNWDAPVVVTTAVQFFESLFSNEPSRCRKLHNIARAVIVVDEAQTLPAEFLLCLLDGMRQLARHYGSTIVLSTATQPALGQRDTLPQGLDDVREIVGDVDALASALQRIAPRWPAGDAVQSYAELVTELAAERQVLAVVHRRQDARELAERLPADGRYHLSTRMCAAHRGEILAQMRHALAAGDVCRVVSTQLIEAGVDVDFPTVYRAMAGLDSLAQAAGRCNRNGLLVDATGRATLGKFVVFRAETSPPVGTPRRGLDVAEGMLRARGGQLDFTDAATLDEFFRGLYFASDLDSRKIMAHRRSFNFATVAELLRFIDDGTRPVVVPWNDAVKRVAAFEREPRRETARALQPYVVQVREDELRMLDRQGALAPLEGFGHVLSTPFLHLYDAAFGLTLDEEKPADVRALVQ